MNNNIDKSFMWHDHLSLWFSLGVGLLVIQMGSFLSPALSTKEAILAIIIGSLIGSMILALVARLGQQTGNNSAQLMVNCFGASFAKLPILLNIIQLLGWTAFEIVIMSEGLSAIFTKQSGIILNPFIIKIIFGIFIAAILLFLLSKPMVGMVRKFVAKIALPLVFLSLLWLSYYFINKMGAEGFNAFINKSGDGSMSFLSAIDLVIAMPISWLPLIADYARHGRSPRSTHSGTLLGYAFANIWCYGLGFLIISSSNNDLGMVSTILLSQGGLLALGIILFDEVDNAYGDVYSANESAKTLLPNINNKYFPFIIVGFALLSSIFLPMHDLERFLIMLSSVFIPLYGVILGRFWKKNKRAPSSKAFEPVVFMIWIAGIALFHFIISKFAFIGASLPCFCICFVLARFYQSKLKT